jgi:hypothetical protein
MPPKRVNNSRNANFSPMMSEPSSNIPIAKFADFAMNTFNFADHVIETCIEKVHKI